MIEFNVDMRYLKQINEVRKSDRVGNKAHSIRQLQKHRLITPFSLVIPAHVHLRYMKAPEATIQRLSEQLEKRITLDKTYAVRSSAELEDGPDYSFAGQFKTLLDLKGIHQMVNGILEVWNSGEKHMDSEYVKRMGLKKPFIGMGILIQEMVNPLWSGAGFSVHPVTGMNEVVIEGVRGDAVDLLQQGKEPFRWIYNCTKGEFGVPIDESNSPGQLWLNLLANEIIRIKRFWKNDVDVEWAFDGEKLLFLQCRSVTISRYPNVYSNHISREFLPGMIKPLVWSINIPVVNSAWITLLEKLLGKTDIQPEELSKSFYYRAYFNMGTMGKLFSMLGLPKQSLEYMMGIKKSDQRALFKPSLQTFRYIPRILFFLVSNLRLGHHFQEWIKGYITELNVLSRKLDDSWAVSAYPELFNQIMFSTKKAAYFNIIIPLTMQLSNQLLKRRCEKRGYSFYDLDFSWETTELKEYDPRYRLYELHLLWQEIPLNHREEGISIESLRQYSDSEIVQRFLRAYDQLILKFGFFSESGNDFSSPHWREQPDLVLDMIQNAKGEFLKRGDSNSRPTEAGSNVCRGAAYRRAGRYRLYREMISSQYTRGYGMYRKLFLRTGGVLKKEGVLEKEEDVYFLTLAEHDLLIKQPDKSTVDNILDKLQTRKREMEEYKDIDLPSVIFGEVPPPLKVKNDKAWTGIPTSPGLFEGKIVVVRGFKEFNKEVDGSILVIPYADVGWTPLLLRAGAIVSESGGILSHAAIVAREMSIPSISSVDHACKLNDGELAVVNGTNGTLELKH
jgi:pyruvate,water dikinase